mgnify:CR=1
MKKETITGIKSSIDDKEDFEYIKLMVECMFEEICRNSVDTDQVKNYVKSQSKNNVRKKR